MLRAAIPEEGRGGSAAGVVRRRRRPPVLWALAVGCLAALVSACAQAPAAAVPLGHRSHRETRPAGVLGGIDRLRTLASTTPSNGDENPYAVLVAPVSAGVVAKGDVLVDNFNASSNKQGTGRTIVAVSPAGKTVLFATVPADLAGCPGGIGLTTAMAMLSTGWVIVGSTPSSGGTTATAGPGCLILISPSGKAVSTISGPDIDGPWDMATVDQGSTATLLLTNTLVGVKGPGQPVVDQGDLVRITLAVPSSGPPTVSAMTVIATGFPEHASASAFVIGPTGVSYVDGTAYVADPLANAVVAVPHALTRSSAATPGRVISRGHLLRHPLALVAGAHGELLLTNGLDGDIVELSTGGRQLGEVAVDPDPSQSPPGSGDLFGLALTPSGRSVYFAKDDTNTLGLLH